MTKIWHNWKIGENKLVKRLCLYIVGTSESMYYIVCTSEYEGLYKVVKRHFFKERESSDD